MNKKLVLATVATIAAVGTAQGVYADEVQGTTGTGTEASGITASNSGRLGEEKMKQRQLLNNQLLKIQMEKQEAKATITTNREMLHNLQKMGVIFK